MDDLKISIQSLIPEKITDFKELRLQALRDTPNAFAGTYEIESKFTEEEWKTWVKQLTSSGEIFLAQKGNQKVGMIFCYVKKEFEKTAGIGSIWVKPNYRGQGIARGLFQSAFDWARKKELNEVRLGNSEGNIAAQKLYQSVGFSYTGRKEPLTEGSNIIVYEMIKQL